jgi:hypothetical protein
MKTRLAYNIKKYLRYATVHPHISKSMLFRSPIGGRKWKVFLQITRQKWSQIYNTTSRRCLNRAHK